METQYRFNDTSLALEFEVESDIDPILESLSSLNESSNDTIQLQDNSEGRITFKDSRMIRWQRRLYCDGNQTTILKARLVKDNSTPPTNNTGSKEFNVKYRLYITIFIQKYIQCKKLQWDPIIEIGTVDDELVPQTTTTTTSNPTISSTITQQTSSTLPPSTLPPSTLPPSTVSTLPPSTNSTVPPPSSTSVTSQTTTTTQTSSSSSSSGSTVINITDTGSTSTVTTLSVSNTLETTSATHSTSSNNVGKVVISALIALIFMLL